MKKLLETELAGLEEELKARIKEAAETIEAIKNNEIDAFVINTQSGEKVFTLQLIENIYNIILDSLSLPAITFTEDGKIIYANKLFYDLIKIESNRTINSMSIYEIISSSSYKAMESFLLNSSGVEIQEMEFTVNNETAVIYNITAKVIKSDGVTPFNIIIINSPKEIKFDTPHHQQFTSSELIATVVCDNNGTILRLNKSAITLSGRPVINIDFDTAFNLCSPEGKKITINEMQNSPEQAAYEVVFTRNDGRIFYLDLTKESLKDVQGNNHGFVLTLIDMTKHIIADSKAQASLKEKTMLLKEVHHRVKNSLQIVSSIINLQSMHLTDPAVIGIFSELNARLNSVSLIHEKLYKSEDVSEIRLDKYIQDLINYIRDSYNLTDDKVTIICNIDPLFFGMDDAVHIGLLVTEAITNSVKYAFPEKKGKIWLTMKMEGNQTMLVIKDNGIGIPDKLNIKDSETLGLQLIKSISDQLNGKIEIKNDNGTELKLIIPSVRK